jgi:xanthine dehydrogenase/oxidase
LVFKFSLFNCLLSATQGANENIVNCYDRNHIKIESHLAVTNTPSNTWCRAPGTVEGIAMIENIMDHIAFVVKKDPVDVRMQNIPADSEMRQHLNDFVKSVDYRNRKNEIDTFNEGNRWIKRGISIVPMRYPMGYFGSLHALVSIYHGDGSVSITVGGIECGQGLNTKVAQTAAHILKLPLDKISIKPSTSMTAPNAIVTGGSQGSEVCCFATKKACEMLLDRLKPIKAANPSAEWPEIIDKAYAGNIDLMASYLYKAEELNAYLIWGISCCEVEVDILSGNLLIKRVDIMEDVGESLSPGIDIGQIEGAFVMGLGYWLTESLIFNNQTGELLTNRTWNYKVPGAKDIPIDFRINFLSKAKNPFGVLRSKATGEPASALAVSALFAVRNALNSAVKDAGSSESNNHLTNLGAPTTTELIFLAACNKIEQFLLN